MSLGSMQGHCLWRVHAGMVGGRVSLRSLVFALLVLLPGHKEGGVGDVNMKSGTDLTCPRRARMRARQAAMGVGQALPSARGLQFHSKHVCTRVHRVRLCWTT
jgi:hypothetical protein